MPISNKDQEKILETLTLHNIKYKLGWKNFCKTVTLPNALVLSIKNYRSLTALIKVVHNLNLHKKINDKITLRVAAGGLNEPYSHSYSLTPCTAADIIINLTGACFRSIRLKDKAKGIVKVGAAVQIGALDKTLYDKFKLVLPTSSLIPYVTIGGLTANAGHGTGRDQPSICGLINTMTICRPDGKIIKITDTNANFKIIRGAHLGLFGIVLDMEIRCAPAKKMQCTLLRKNINDLQSDIKQGLFYKNSYVSVMYVPTYFPDEKTQTQNKNVLILKWQPVALEEKNTLTHVTLRQYGQEFAIKLGEKFAINTLLAAKPNLIPYYMKYIVSRIAIGNENSITTGPWPAMMHYQTSYPWQMDDSDFLFNVSPDSHEINEALDHVTARLATYAAKEQYPITHAIYLRFFKGTQGGLSTSAAAPTKYVCSFDIVSNPGNPGYTAFKKEMTDYFIKSLDAKPHWGKSIPSQFDYATMYGENFQLFMQTLKLWYRNCSFPLEKSAFINPFISNILQLTPIQEKTSIMERKALPRPFKLAYSSKSAEEFLFFLKSQSKQDFYCKALIKQIEKMLQRPKFFNSHTNREQEEPVKKAIKVYKKA